MDGNQSGRTIQNKVINLSIFLFLPTFSFAMIAILTIYKFLHVIVRDVMALHIGIDKDNNSFQLIHCWNRLKNEAKWHSKCWCRK